MIRDNKCKAKRARMADKLVSFVGIVFDARRNSEGDFDLNKCTVFGITKEVSKFMFVWHSKDIFTWVDCR